VSVHRTVPASVHASWIRAVVLLAAAYALVGIAFAAPTSHVHAWRLAAWVVSAIAYASHMAYERFRLRNSPAAAALHIAGAVALGALGLAVSANVHSLSTAATSRRQSFLLLSLVIWPVITAVPAFLVALGIQVVLARAVARTQRK
jgi:hypothetical protein